MTPGQAAYEARVTARMRRLVCRGESAADSPSWYKLSHAERDDEEAAARAVVRLLGDDLTRLREGITALAADFEKGAEQNEANARIAVSQGVPPDTFEQLALVQRRHARRLRELVTS